MQMFVTTRDGNTHVIEGSAGISLMTLIRDAGIDEISALCGGCCACATCHVPIDEAWFPRVGGPGRDENDLLESSVYRNGNSRLSCQVMLADTLDGLRVTIPPED